MKEAIIAEVLKRLPREEYIEDEEGIQWRKGFLRMIGYKS